MRVGLFFALLLACLTSSVSGEPVAKASWPMFRNDLKATGLAASTLPEPMERLWTFSPPRGRFEATAVIADGAVYVGGLHGPFYALDLATGRKLWEYPTEMGFNAAAAVADGLACVGDTDGRLHCFDARSGTRKWYFDAGSEINSGVALLRHAGQVRLLAGSQDCFLYCLEASSGKLVWKFESQQQIRCFPTVVENRVFVAGCDGRLHVIDLANGAQTAEVNLDGVTGSAPSALGDRVFVGTEGQAFLAIDWRKGQVVWRYTSPIRRASYRSSAAVADDLVVVGSQDRHVHAMDPQTGKSLWTFASRGHVDGSPVIVGDRVYVGSADGRLYGLDRKTGRERWRFEIGGSLLASPAVADGRLVVGSTNGTLSCFGKK